MAITNGYCTLANFKLYGIENAGADSDDDAFIEMMIEAASRYIDAQTGRTFYARTETRYYDVPSGRTLLFDDDLLTITALTNGDDNTIAATEYNFLPRNVTPYYGLRLTASTSTYFQQDSSGNVEDVISVAGTWGFVASTPDDVEQACFEIVKSMYNRRAGQGTEGVATITGAGVVITPRSVPPFAQAVIQRYRKRL